MSSKDNEKKNRAVDQTNASELTPGAENENAVTPKKSKKKKVILSVIISLVAVILIVIIFAGNYLVNYAIGKGGDGGNRQVSLDVQEAEEGIKAIISANRALAKSDNEIFLNEHPAEQVSIVSNDDLTLQGFYFANDSHKWAITIHGYRNNHSGMMNVSRNYFEQGFQVLTPDLRACGESDGDYVGMGWLDKSDILKWIDWILQKDPEAEILLHGVSMGAATTMMTSGENTPDQVKLFVEDCGYTSVWDIFASELKLRFGLPTFPVLYSASAMSKIKAGYSFGEADALEQVKKCTKPMLFIHGDVDNFIPYEMLDVLYTAKPGDNKQKLTVAGAGHGESYYADPDTYWSTVFDFVGQYIK